MSQNIRAPFPPTLPGLLLAGMLLTGCLMSPVPEPDRDPARVSVEMSLEASAAMTKSSGALLSRAIVLLVSNERDTLRDTITPQGSRLSTDPATFLIFSNRSPLVISARYNLSPYRTWKISTRIFDERDSLRLEGSVEVKNLEPFEYRSASLPLKGYFLAYAMEFLLPQEIRIRQPDSVVTRRLYFTRLSVTLDGVLSRDTVCSTGFAEGCSFASSWLGCGPSGILLSDDYVKSGSRKIGLSAYGYLEGETGGVTSPRLLFQGTHDIDSAFTEEPSTVPLEWKAATAAAAIAVDGDNEQVTVKLGRVTTNILNITVPGGVVL
jgi:hypothetical protein